MGRTVADVRDSNERKKKCEAQGLVADSHDYRLELMQRMRSGEITAEQGQDELKKTKRFANRNGLLTSDQAYGGTGPAEIWEKYQP